MVLLELVLVAVLKALLKVPVVVLNTPVLTGLLNVLLWEDLSTVDDVNL